jgi:regulator of sirC expression with transglutaminase-like and TPR domain
MLSINSKSFYYQNVRRRLKRGLKWHSKKELQSSTTENSDFFLYYFENDWKFFKNNTVLIDISNLRGNSIIIKVKSKTVKISLLQALEAHSVARG